jgi:hypothetical protein
MMNALKTPLAFHMNQAPNISVDCPSAHGLIEVQKERPRFLQLAEWDEHNSYDEKVPTCLHYTIEWKVYVNKSRYPRIPSNISHAHLMRTGTFAQAKV